MVGGRGNPLAAIVPIGTGNIAVIQRQLLSLKPQSAVSECGFCDSSQSGDSHCPVHGIPPRRIQKWAQGIEQRHLPVIDLSAILHDGQKGMEHFFIQQGCGGIFRRANRRCLLTGRC